jgi:hypothetical protein
MFCSEMSGKITFDTFDTQANGAGYYGLALLTFLFIIPVHPGGAWLSNLLGTDRD